MCMYLKVMFIMILYLYVRKLWIWTIHCTLYTFCKKEKKEKPSHSFQLLTSVLWQIVYRKNTAGIPQFGPFEKRPPLVTVCQYFSPVILNF